LEKFIEKKLKKREKLNKKKGSKAKKEE